jgi:peptide/nickel transport system permease protein
MASADTQKRGGGFGLPKILASPAVRFLARRLSQAVVVMLVVVIGNFVLLQLAPGDLVDVIAGKGDMTLEQMAALRAQYGLDQPWPLQLLYYIGRLATFDLGYSPLNAAPVLDIILSRLPTTAILVVLSVVFSVTFGALMGVFAARKAGSIADMTVSTAAMILHAMPSFIVGIGLILLLSVQFRWLPAAGLVSVGKNLKGLAYLQDLAAHLIMPVLALCTSYLAVYARICRATMLEILTLDYIRTARAKGLTERRVIYVHALRNALLPLVTMAGLQISALLGGAVLIETIFGLPGMGRTAFDAVFERDTNLLLGVLFVSSLGVVVVSLCVDLLYVLLDPRVKV